MWIANYGAQSVTKLLASDGSNAGNFPSGGENADGILFDGRYIWVCNAGFSALYIDVVKLNLDGSINSTMFVSGSPAGLAFDGANVWVANGNLMKM